MVLKPKQPKGRDRALSTLDVFIQALDLANNACGIPPAKIAFGTTRVLLATIRDTMANKRDYVELGKSCAGVCEALSRSLNGDKLDSLSQPVVGAIELLTTTLAEIQRNVIEHGERTIASRLFHSSNDKDLIAGWRRDLNSILHTFTTELLINNHIVLLDVRDQVSAGLEDPNGSRRTQATVGSCEPPRPRISRLNGVPIGEMPPQPPRACFGRNSLIAEIVSLAKKLEPIALIGAGGIGKTSVALAVLHHDHIKERFGDNRRFICCDQFPASRAQFLARLSKVIGAGVENPDDLTPLQPFLSSREMILILDNAESILDPQGADAQGIHDVVKELSRYKNICLGITSRISTVPPHCNRPTIPPLSMESACDIFYAIHKTPGGRTDLIRDLVKQLDFHALSITLLATTASHNMWDYERLVQEWETQRAQVLQANYNESLAATIELSLASPTFQKLGPDARDLLGVVAFFPQGINENNLEWLFPAISNRRVIFDKFSVLSLTSLSNGFITMLAPIRDYLCPQTPDSSPLLCTTRDHYFNRLSVKVAPHKPGFEEARWIVSEDVNVEHLLYVYTAIGANPGEAWDACARFMKHLAWHKPRKTVLRQRIEGLPDDHPSKPRCLFQLARLFHSIGNDEEQKQVLTHTLGLERKRGNELRIARTLDRLADTNRMLGLHEEGISQVREASEIFERLGRQTDQSDCLITLAWLFFYAEQLDSAEEAATRAVESSPGAGREFQVCQCHRLLGKIYHSKGEKEKAIHHFHSALEIASTPNCHSELFWVHLGLAVLFRDEGEFDDAHVHIEQAKSDAADATYNLGRAMDVHARIWFQQGKFEEARDEALGAIEIYEKLGALKDLGDCKGLLGEIDSAIENRTTAVGSNSGGDVHDTASTPITYSRFFRFFKWGKWTAVQSAGHASV